MPTQPLDHVSSQEFRNPDPTRSVGAYYAKRTQFTPPKMRNEPNSRPATRRIYETNPIYHPNSQKMRNEPNFRVGFRISPRSNPQFLRNEPNFHKVNSPKMQNEPNFRVGFRISPRPNPQFSRNEPNPSTANMRNEPNLPSRQLHTTTFSAKRTQFTTAHNPNTQNEPNLGTAGILPPQASPQIWETNPITQNEPNLIHPPRRSCSHFAKRTQSQHGPQPKMSKRSGDPPVAGRNEPNLGTAGILPPRACPQICETNPIRTGTACRAPTTRNEPNSVPRPARKRLAWRFDRLGGRLFNLPALRRSSGIQHYRTWESISPDNSVNAVIISNVVAKE